MPTMCSDPGSCSATSMANILDSERFIEQGKMVLYEGRREHQPNAFISLVDLIGESSDWVEYIKEMQEKPVISNLELKLKCLNTK
ncbi:UNVERIFIED_CONTAM: hypothetical protein Sradi_5999500 [Sesamum radiatum]|uniref:Uncharacterized protein n=1 Tax=Sesamum radiatum TaxID=300843 RepID=A0AAW2KFV7_SESRA